jgi:protein gp37
MSALATTVLDLCGALEHSEQKIERATRNAFYEVGTELRHIRDQRLYRERYGTFEDYCQERWEWTAQHVGRLIMSADVVDQIEPIGSILPDRESHVRPLLLLDEPDQRAEAWKAALAAAEKDNDRVKARHVEAAVRAMLTTREFITLAEWDEMKPKARRDVLSADGAKKFNRQDNNNIEWAQWSWNPITGCKHGCEFCYARDISARFGPPGVADPFAPVLWTSRLSAPQHTKVPDGADGDIGLRNVFAVSMGDLFGAWVPDEWIDAVMGAVRAAPQWNFLFLTKNPKRLPSVDFPANAWVGTTVNTQKMVKAAEDAFSKVKATVKFLSCEPLYEDLHFKHLDRFDWIIIGGASKSTRTPEYRPPRDHINNLEAQAREAGCKIYEKPNLLERIREYPLLDTGAP